MIRTCFLLLVAIAGLLTVGLAYGDYSVPTAQVIGAIIGDPATPPDIAMIVMQLRMPRLLLALMVGLALGAAGAIAQAVMRNPLAEPGLLGINNGAGLAAMVLMVGMERAPDYLLPPAAFAGATAMAAAIYALWSVADANWSKVEAMFAWSLLPLIAVWLTARELDTISFGDDSARSLGQRVNLVRGLMILMCTALSGAAVAFAGLVGFVGLIAPHMARRLVGNGHGRIIPAAALLGAVLVMTADFVGRTIIAPAQLPAGLLTALLGAPFFAWLMWERRHVPA
jgi:iron complex transport system permease protein